MVDVYHITMKMKNGGTHAELSIDGMEVDEVTLAETSSDRTVMQDTGHPNIPPAKQWS